MKQVAHRKAKSITNEYATLVTELKHRIKSAHLQVSRVVNRELIQLYWDIGKAIALRQKKLGWGKSVVEKLASDLRTSFPGQKGFSPQQLWFMRQMYVEFSDRPILLQLARELPWYHIVTIMTKIKETAEREYYLRAAVSYNWSRAVLVHQIESHLYFREVKAQKTHNFKRLLPRNQAHAVDEIMKDPYILDFMNLQPEAKEREIEQQLILHLRQFLTELGAGFAFVGSQYRLQVGNEEFFIDLLFYHLRLRRFIVIELKTISFKPEFAGKMNFYLTAVDNQLKHKDDEPSIGMLLCKDKDDVVVEYALRDIRKPLGVVRYQTTERLPKQLARVFPTNDDLKRTLKEPIVQYRVIPLKQTGNNSQEQLRLTNTGIPGNKLKRNNP